jgi:hypothetical protein
VSAPPPPRTLEDVVADRRIAHNDCRDCRNYAPHPSGLSYGWCDAFAFHVKLYHPAGAFFSQCRFKSLVRPKREPGL